jgi:D-3-phosphoglycerate dehydrogenase
LIRILVSDKLGDAGLEQLDKAEDVAYDLRLDLNKEELLDIIAGYDALIVRSGTKVDADVLAAGSNLKVVGRAGMGVDNIDIRAATARGIIVMNTPQANSIATAEQTIALMLAVSRYTAEAHESLSKGEWRRSDFVGQQLYRKVLGVIGFGRIGRLVAARAQGFAMEILAYDPYISEDVARELGVTLVDLDDLLVQSDYITLHTVVSPETTKMINAETISKMKPGAIIVNVSRGKLIDESALADALKSGHLKAAALDVFVEEPPSDSPLIGLPNVLHTPHLGASSIEAQRDVATQIADQVLDALRGTDFRDTINMPFHAGPDFATTRPYMDLAEKLGIFQWAMAPTPIRRIQVEVRGDMVDRLVRPVASALLKGILEKSLSDPVNYINAPVLAEEHGISITQSVGLTLTDYPNLISCIVHWDGGKRLVAGVLFGSSGPRIVQVDNFQLDANLRGLVLILENQDVPGVIGQVGTILATHQVNIDEWRMGRLSAGGKALSFINLDDELSPEVLESLTLIPAVTNASLLSL